MASDAAINQKRLQVKRILAQRVLDQRAPQPEAPQAQPIGQRIGEDLASRAQTIQETQAARAAGEQGFIETGLQQGAQVALGGVDVLGEGAVSAFRALPDVIEEPLRAGGAAVAGAIGGIPLGERTLGERLTGGVQQAGEFLEERPRLARNLAIAEAAAIALPIKIPGVTVLRGGADVTGSALGRIGEAIVGAGEKQALKQKAGLASELMAPIESRKFLEQANLAGRVSESPITKNRIIAPTDRDIKAAEILTQLDIKPNKSFTANNKVALRGISQKAQQLVKELEGTKVIFPKAEVRARLNSKIDEFIQTQPFLVGNSELTAERVKKIVLDAIDNNLSTPAGLLKARKQFDSELKSQTRQASGKTIFDSDADRAVNLAIKEIRDVVNGFIAEKAPSVDVRRLLGEQELLFGARDVISAKAAQEGSNSLRRLIDELPLKGDTAKILGVTALTGGAIALPAAAGLAATGLVGAATVKGLRGPGAKKALGEVLRGADKAIRLEKDAGVLRQLRADRAVVLEMFKSLETEGQE